jgi:DNA polymerase-3 subunit gamma/tau
VPSGSPPRHDGEPATVRQAEPIPEPELEPETEPKPQSGPLTPLAEPASEQEVGSWWAALVERLPLDGAARNLARNAVLAQRNDDQWALRLSSGHQVLVNQERTEELAAALSDYFQRRIRLAVTFDNDTGATPEALDQERRRLRLEEARRSLFADDTVCELLDRFNGRLDEDSIRPREP